MDREPNFRWKNTNERNTKTKRMINTISDGFFVCLHFFVYVLNTFENALIYKLVVNFAMESFFFTVNYNWMQLFTKILSNKKYILCDDIVQLIVVFKKNAHFLWKIKNFFLRT